jgi:hypothetical protein
MLCMEEKAVSEIKARGRIARVAAWFVRLPVAVKGIITTVEFGLAVGCVWAAWTAGGDMALIVPALALGLFFGVVGIASIPELRWRSKAFCMGVATLFFVGIGGFLYWHFKPAQPETRPVSNPSASPVTPKQPPLVSTYQKVIIACDKPKSEKGFSKKERQDRLEKYSDFMKRVFGYTVKGKIEEEETTLEIIPNAPMGDPTMAITKQTYFIKRVGDQLFVTITNDFSGPLAFMLQLARPDSAEQFSRTIIEQIEKLTGVESGKCK